MSEVVLYEVKDRVAIITLNRPDRLNAWTNGIEAGYFDALEQAAGDPDVVVAVLTGAGRGFCAGADMAALQAIGDGGGRPRLTDGLDTPPVTRPPTYPLRFPKPLIAAINGACAGIGWVHALMADIRFAAAGAKFTAAFARRGLIAEHGSSWLLPRLIGTSNALDVLLSSRVLLSEEAHAMGMVNRVFPPERLMDETLAYAADMALNCSPASLAVMKKQVYRHWSADVDEARDESFAWMLESLRSTDFKEGVQSFVDRRAPNFSPLAAGMDELVGPED